MRLVFLGTPPVAVPFLDALKDAGHDLRLIVSRPDRPVGRSGKPVPPAVARAARRLGVELIQPRKVRDRLFRETLAAAAPDALIVVAYGRILPGPVLELARHGAVNVHFSLLPRLRGAAPVQWALARGEQVTGVSIMRMNERMDEGAILLQQEIPIETGEHAPRLAERLVERGTELLLTTLDRLAEGTLIQRPQDDGRATYAPLLSAEDGQLDPAWSAAELAGRVAGFDPWPGVWMRTGGRRIRILEARVDDGGFDGSESAGRFVELREDGLVLSCAANTRVVLRRLQPEGKKPLLPRDAINGRYLRVGDRVEFPVQD